MVRDRLLRTAVAAATLCALFTPFRRDLFVGDETKYGEVVREMRATGRWFLPTLEGTPFTHKPPLHFWLIDALTSLFGTHSLWPFVLPSLAAFVALTWLLVRSRGWLAAFICGTSLLVWSSAQSARMDVAFTALITLGVLLLEHFFDAGDFRALTLAAAAWGVATLVKGPMAFVIAVALFALEAWRRRGSSRDSDRRGRLSSTGSSQPLEGRRRLSSAVGYATAIFVAALIPLAWFVPAMLAGGNAYTHEVLQKQLAGRAIGAWVHQSPPWFYLTHSPGYLFPWFLPAIAAIALRWREDRFEISWILAVLVPYSLMSSKLDVYMMALIPPVAIILARAIERREVVAASRMTMVILFCAGIAGFFILPHRIPAPEAQILDGPALRVTFVILAGASLLAIAASSRSALAATIALGFVPIVTFAWIALALMPQVNEIASTRPLVRALEAQGVPGSSMALYTCPHLWTRDLPDELEQVHYASPETLASLRPSVIATSRSHAGEIATQLAGWRRTATVRMIGKWFDVYRR